MAKSTQNKSRHTAEKRGKMLDDLFLTVVNDREMYEKIYPIVEGYALSAIEDVANVLMQNLRYTNFDCSIAQVDLIRSDHDARDEVGKALVEYYFRDLLHSRIATSEGPKQVDQLEEEIARLSGLVKELTSEQDQNTKKTIMDSNREEAPIVRNVIEVGGVDISTLKPSDIRTKIRELREIIKDNLPLVEEGSSYAKAESSKAQEAIKVLVTELDTRQLS